MLSVIEPTIVCLNDPAAATKSSSAITPSVISSGGEQRTAAVAQQVARREFERRDHAATPSLLQAAIFEREGQFRFVHDLRIVGGEDNEVPNSSRIASSG